MTSLDPNFAVTHLISNIEYMNSPSEFLMDNDGNSPDVFIGSSGLPERDLP